MDDGGLMLAHGPFHPPAHSEVSPAVREAIYPLYWKDVFMGSCFAVSETVVVTAGHHYNMQKDDVGDFSVLAAAGVWVVAEFAAKNPACDVAVFWLLRPVAHFTALRGFLPPVRSRVVTVWLSPRSPHGCVVSPGEVIESDAEECVVRGTVSTTGSSGAPVVDVYGSHVVGLHLTSNTRNGSRVSGVLPARKLVSVLAEMGVSCR